MIPHDQKIRFQNTVAVGTPLNSTVNAQIASVGNYLNARGWDVAETTAGNSDTVQQGTLSDSALAQTELLGFQSDCQTVGGEPLCKHHRCRITINQERIDNATVGMTNNQKATFRRNVIRHEMFHCAGLAHNGTSGQLISQFTSSATSSTTLSPNASESTILSEFSP